MKRKLFAALLCLAMAFALLPMEAAAAGERVLIAGASLNAGTPYYTNGGGTHSTEPAAWNAYLDIAASTLYLNGFAVSTNQERAVEVQNFAVLYVSLAGANTAASTNDGGSATAFYAPDTTDLVFYGSGSLEAQARATGGVGIRAKNIRLQYPATLIAAGDTKATGVRISCSNDAYGAPLDQMGDPISAYNGDATIFLSQAVVRFAPKAVAIFPVWVNGQRVTSANMNAVPVSSGSAVYTPAAGAAPAKLTLTGAGIDTQSSNPAGTYTAGILAEEEPLCLRLSGSSSISAMGGSVAGSCGVYSKKALTIEAEPAALLAVDAAASGGNPNTPNAIYSEGGIVFAAGCGLLQPNGATISGNGLFISAADGTTALDDITLGAFSYSVALSPAARSFGSVQPGYVQPAAQLFEITNTGNQPTGALTLTLGGATPTAFTLSETGISGIAAQAAAPFSVQPKADLPAGSYSASVTVSGANIAAQTISVQFTVAAPAGRANPSTGVSAAAAAAAQR